MKPSLKRRKQQPRSKKAPGIKRNLIRGNTHSSEHKNRREIRAKKEANAKRELQPQNAKKPIYDVLKGRNVYSVIDASGKKRYVSKESEASAREKAKGLFIKDSSKESDATQEERNQGLYVEESSLNLPVQAKQASEGGLPIRDLGKDRKVYPTISEQGNPVFLPRARDVTAYEKRKGLFVTDDSAAAQTQGKQMASGNPIRDLGKNRMVYPTESSSETIVFYPRQSEATPDEITKGQFVTDESVKDQIEKKASQKEEAKYNKDKNRFEYPYEDQEGEITYLPKESEASEEEKANGQFVNNKSTENPADQWAPITNGKPRAAADRYLYPVTDRAGNFAYIPLEAKATQRELDNGLYLPFDTIENPDRIAARAARMQRLYPTPPITVNNAIDQDRLLYEVTDPNGDIRYLPKASEATTQEIAKEQFIQDEEVDVTIARQDVSRKPFAEATDGTALWDGKSLPAPTEVQQLGVLRSLKPIFDSLNGRMLYPIGEAGDAQKHMPLVEDATPEEIADGNYAQFNTEQPLEDFVLQNIDKITFEINGGTIEAITITNLERAFEEAPLMLVANKDIEEQLKNMTSTVQGWVG